MLHQGGDDLLRQPLLGGQGLLAPGLRDVKGFGDGETAALGAILPFILLVGVERIPRHTASQGTPGFFPLVEGTGVGDGGILFIEDEKVPGALRGALCHEIEKPFHGGVIPEHLLGLGVHPCLEFFPFRLSHGGVFLFGKAGCLLLGLLLLLFANQCT